MTISRLPKPIARKYWGGSVLPPFLVGLDSALSQYEFEFAEHDNDAPCSVWRRRLFDGYELHLNIWPRRSDALPGRYSFGSSLAIWSARQADVEHSICIQDCWKLDPAFFDDGVPRANPAVGVLSLSFNLLIASWEPQASEMSGALNRWDSIELSKNQDHIDDFMHFFRQQGVKFIEFVESREKLARVLASMEAFPGMSGHIAPVSSSPRVFASVLFADCGDFVNARRQLEVHLEKSAAISSTEFIIASCVTKKYKDWLLDLHGNAAN